MKTLNVSRAKAQFSGIARRVIKKRETVAVKMPAGYVQIMPFEVPDFVLPAGKGSIQLTDREIELANKLGDSLCDRHPAARRPRVGAARSALTRRA